MKITILKLFVLSMMSERLNLIFHLFIAKLIHWLIAILQQFVYVNFVK